MCDWDAEEYEEYLRWVEAARARERAAVRARPSPTASWSKWASGDATVVAAEV